MAKWEYRVEITEVGGSATLNVDKITDKWLNNIGSDRWELVNAITLISGGRTTKQCYLIFKRPVE